MTFKNIISTVVVTSSSALIFTACEKELDFTYHEIPPITVVEGIFTQNGGGVRVTATTPMDEPLDTTPLTDALITVSDGQNDYPLSPDDEGLYRLPEGIFPQVGLNYTISIINGNQASYGTSTMLPPVEIVDMNFSYVEFPGVQKAVLELVFTDPQPDVENYYWATIYRNGRTFAWSCARDIYKIDDLVHLSFFTSDKEPADDADFYEKLEPGDVVTAKVYPVDRKMFDYLMSAAMPGKNMIPFYTGDECLGYFLTAPEASASLIYNPEVIFP